MLEPPVRPIEWSEDRVRIIDQRELPGREVWLDLKNAEEMAGFRYYQDVDSSRGLGVRATMRDRQRMAQVFLARSMDPEATLEKKLLNQAVNQFTALRFFSKGYTT